MNKIYTGVGSRNNPAYSMHIIAVVGRLLAEQGWTVRSGAAEGSDTDFERASDSRGGMKEIYLPYEGFNKSTSNLFQIPQEAFDIASQVHPNWGAVKQKDRALHARNVQQVLGQALNKPSEFLLCYTMDGLITGGTSTAIRVAKMHEIPVYNIGGVGTEIHNKRLRNFLKEFKVEVPDGVWL